jgi:hypothetical protein
LPDLGAITPFEKITECGREFCGPSAPEALNNTIKHLIIVALSRLNVGGIKNNEFINWVLEPLGVVFEADENECPDGGDVNNCIYRMKLTPTVTEFVEWKGYVGCKQIEGLPIPNVYLNANCNNSVVAPALLAAHCIVKSLLHCKMNVSITLNLAI